MDQRSGNGGIHSPAERAYGPAAFSLLSDRLHHGSDESSTVPILCCAANLKDEVIQNLGAALRVIYLRMKLHAVQFLVRVLHRSDGVVGPSRDAKSLRQSDDVIAVAVPDFEPVGAFREKL